MGANEINGAGMPQDIFKAGKKLSDADKQKLEKAKTNGEIQKQLKAKNENPDSISIQERNAMKVDAMSLEDLKKLDEKLTNEKAVNDAKKELKASEISNKQQGKLLTIPAQIKNLEARKAEIQKELKENGDNLSDEDYIVKELEIDMIDKQIISLKLKQKKDVEQPEILQQFFD